MRKRTLIAWSGGKDSAWALHVLSQQPEVEVAGIFTTVDEERDQIAVHCVRTSLLRAQAASAGVALHTIAIPRPCPNAVYESAMARFVEQAKADGVTHLAFGDLFLEDIRRYRERQFAASGMQLLFPLWGLPTDRLAREMTDQGLRALIVCVDLKRAPREWAGAVFDPQFVARIPGGIDPCGENGEFHTFVREGPMLRAPLDVRAGAIHEAGGFAYADLCASL
jgi:uncharacterized protein (TIGR00290 family)